MDIFGAEFDPSRPSMQGLPFLSPMKDLLASLPDDKPVKTRKSRRTLVLMKNGQDDAGNEDGVGSQESDSVGDESGGVADADNDEEEDEVDADASTVADEDEDDREADFMDEDKNLGEEGTEPRHEEDEDGGNEIGSAAPRVAVSTRTDPEPVQVENVAPSLIEDSRNDIVRVTADAKEESAAAAAETRVHPGNVGGGGGSNGYHSNGEKNGKGGSRKRRSSEVSLESLFVKLETLKDQHKELLW